MANIWTMGEILVEVMRPEAGMALDRPGVFLGPYPSGAPAIFIDTVARLGHTAGIIGGVGEDDFGLCVLRRLLADGVDCRYVRRVPGKATAVAFVTYFADGSRKFIYHIDGTPAVMADYEGGEDPRGAPDFFHVMGCSLMASDSFRGQIFRAAEIFADRGARISFDPNIRPELLGERSLEEVVGPVLERCAVLLPGAAELGMLSGGQTEEPVQGVERLFARFPLEVVVLKRGRQGCSIYPRGSAPLDVPAYAVDEVDPTGAGDCFDAAFLCAYSAGRPLEECARQAAAAGALAAAAFGPMEGAISPENILQVIRRNSLGG